MRDNSPKLLLRNYNPRLQPYPTVPAQHGPKYLHGGSGLELPRGRLHKVLAPKALHLELRVRGLQMVQRPTLCDVWHN